MRFVVLFLLAATAACRYAEEIDGPDEDGDGFGEMVDCDDGDGDVSPGAPETPYNGVDDDCDEATGDDDVDGDGAALADDCDDLDPSRHPGAAEACNGLDDDCDDETDEAVSGPWFADADLDGYGDPLASTATCTPGTGLVALGGDCNDADATIHPNAQEDCEAVDRDCDGSPDQGVPLEAPGASLWFADTDDDGFGDAGAYVTACAQPTGHVGQAGDCDDAVATIHEGAAETCDGVDQDCDGDLDDGAGDRVAYHLDDDGDGFGDPDVSVLACAEPPDHVVDATDCDDLDAASHPGATEVCDGQSNDCDVPIDEEATDRSTFFADVDGDGFGAGSAVLACTAPANHVGNALDCDDNATDGEDAFPGGVEVCDDALDNDCDGTVDNAYDAFPWYGDADDDGYGDPGDVVWGCEEPVGYVDVAGDCDDTEPAPGVIHPDGFETCDGADEDCNGLVDDIALGVPGQTGSATFYFDPDGDGWSDGVDDIEACTVPPQYVAAANIGDCDETDASINDGAIEVCDGVDHDCDGFIDGDDDHDGFPGGTDCPSLARPDCDDAVAGSYPGRGGCSGGDSCLEILETWEDWNFTEGATATLTWTIDAVGGGTREVTCDMVDDADRPGAGWTRIYAQSAWAAATGWNVTGTYAIPQTGGTGAAVGTCGTLGGVLGPVDLDPAPGIAIMYTNISTAGVPHTHAWLDLKFVFVDDWDLADPGAFIEFENQLEDRVWSGTYAVNGETPGNNLCSPFNTARDELVVPISRGILHDDADPTLLVSTYADGDSTNEGYAVDDVFVWVR